MAYKGKKGLYDDWITGQGLENVCKWAKLGLTDEQLAKNMGIGRTTLYNWLKEFPDFAKAIKEARRIPNLEIENSMFELAWGRVYVEEIKTSLDPKTGEVSKIEKTRRQVPPNPTILIFLAKNRMRDKYKDYAPVQPEPDNNDEQQEVEIYIPDNGRGDNENNS